jgi:hypothetical protein
MINLVKGYESRWLPPTFLSIMFIIFRGVKVAEIIMNAYKKYIPIEDPNNLVLSGLPFQSGQRVEIIIIAEDNPREQISQKLKNLFDKTQEVLGVDEITEADIAAEIDAYRRGE